DTFLSSYKNETGILNYMLDFRKTNSIDSSALGMMMIFREFAEERSADIKIINCSPQIMKMFEIAQFHILFKIV
ncbi:MAG: STAS domain-containing protein, partial [Magnetococcales bacterium]|nr:STAS domain-containing protein [Magnetococcales bacterium]